MQISNTGLTGSIDRYGRITNVFKDRQENNGILYVNYNDSFTIYSQISALLKVIILILALLIAIFREYKKFINLILLYLIRLALSITKVQVTLILYNKNK